MSMPVCANLLYIYFIYFLLTVVWIINPALQDKRETDGALQVPLQPGGD